MVNWFIGANGYLSDVLAKEYGGLVVFSEHRYFGESRPFGQHSYDKGNA
jgi:lysosomal Pro-X carboxypeptidase